MLEIRVITKDNEIPKDYSYDTETNEFYVYRNIYTGDEIHIAKQPPLYIKAIPIPKKATKGDMARAMLSDFTFEDFGDTIIAKRFYPYCHLQFSRKWWDAPFDAVLDEKDTIE